MALTRRFLKTLGIEEDKIEEIISAHGETVSALKDEVEQAKQGANDLAAITKERDTLQQRVDALEKASGDAAKVQADFDAYKKQVEDARANDSKKAVVRKALESAGANTAALELLLGTVDLSKVEMDGDALKDAEAVLKPVRDSYAGLFGQTNPEGTPPVTPPTGKGTMNKEEFEKLPLMKRMEYINAHPEKQKELIG